MRGQNFESKAYDPMLDKIEEILRSVGSVSLEVEIEPVHFDPPLIRTIREDTKNTSAFIRSTFADPLGSFKRAS